MQKASEHPFDERSKTFYTQYFRNKNIRSDQQHFQRVNSLELKGPHDPLTTPDLCLITSRAWAVAGKDKVEQDEIEEDSKFLSKQTLKEIADYPSRRTVTIICVTRPDKILNTPDLQKEYGFEVTSEPGVYKSSKLLTPTWIIHPNELDIVPKNYPLLPLARGKKLKQFIDLCLEKEWESYLYFTMDIGVTIDPSEIFEKMMELFNMKVQIRPETAVKFNQFLEERPEFIMQMPTLRDAIRQGQLFGARGKKLGRLQAEQNMLIRLLRRKFTELPNSVITNIEQTDDTAQLEAWTDQILFANTWQEMFGDSVSA